MGYNEDASSHCAQQLALPWPGLGLPASFFACSPRILHQATAPVKNSSKGSGLPAGRCTDFSAAGDPRRQPPHPPGGFHPPDPPLRYANGLRPFASFVGVAGDPGVAFQEACPAGKGKNILIGQLSGSDGRWRDHHQAPRGPEAPAHPLPFATPYPARQDPLQDGDELINAIE
jgi:hypothetical protein